MASAKKGETEEESDSGEEDERFEEEPSPLDKYIPPELQQMRKGGGKGKGGGAKIDKEIVQIYITDKLMERLGNFKTETIDLIEEFQKFEDYFKGRTYSPLLFQWNIMTPIVRFIGAGDANVDQFYFEFYDQMQNLRRHERLVKKKLDEIVNPIRPLKEKLEKIIRHLDDKDFLDKNPELKEIHDSVPYCSKLLRKVRKQREQFETTKKLALEDAVRAKKVVLKDDGKTILSDERSPEELLEIPDYLGELIQNIPELNKLAQPNPLHEYVITKELGLTNSILDMAWVVGKTRDFTEQYRRFELPYPRSAKIAVLFHRTLNKVLGLGRQIEILFTERFGKILMNHPELREDYAKVEYYALMILRNMVVNDSVITMPPKEFVFAYREVQSRLYLIAGDADALMNRMLTSMTPEPGSQTMMRVAKQISRTLENVSQSKIKKPKKLKPSDFGLEEDLE